MFDAAGLPGADPTRVGEHLSRLRTGRGLTQAQIAGGEFTRAFVSAIEAGKRMPSERAVRYFAQRLQVAPEDLYYGYEPGRRAQLDALLPQARLLLSGGDIDSAEQAYAQVTDSAAAHGDVVLAALGRCGLGRVARHRGDPAAAFDLFTGAEQALAGTPAVQRLEPLIGRIGAAFACGRIADALHLAEDELRRCALAGDTDPTVEFALRAATVLPHLERGDRARAVAAADTALQIASRVTDAELLAQGYYHITRVLVAEHRYTEADKVITLAAALNEHLGLQTETGVCRFARGFLLARQDRLAEAETELRTARQILSATGAISRQMNAAAELADVLRRRGQFDAAAEIVSECRTLADGYTDPEQAAELDRLAGLLAGDRGDTAQAEQLLRSAAGQYAAAGALVEEAITCRHLGDLYTRTGNIAEAAAAYRRGLDRIEQLA